MPLSNPRSGKNIPGPTSGRSRTATCKFGQRISSRICADKIHISTCRETFRQLPSRTACGTNCGAFLPVSRERMLKWLAQSGSPQQLVRSPARVRRTPFPLWCLVIESCARTAISPGTVGGLLGNRLCSSANRSRQMRTVPNFRSNGVTRVNPLENFQILFGQQGLAPERRLSLRFYGLRAFRPVRLELRILNPRILHHVRIVDDGVITRTSLIKLLLDGEPVHFVEPDLDF